MKKSKLIATALLSSTLVLAGCDNGKKECSHVDEKAPWHYCDLCNAKMSDHTFGEWSEKSPADFEHKKVEHRFCSICGEEETREVGDVLPHHYSDVWSHDEEKHWHACTDEGYKNLRKDEAPHSFGEWQERTPASFEAPGVKFRVCECGYEEVDEIPQLQHHYKEEWTTNDTHHWHECTDEGYEDLKDSYGEHIDEDGDYACDICEMEFDHIEGSIVSPLSYMGRGEVLHISSSVFASGSYSSDVVFLMTESDFFTLLDNEDGTAIVTTTSAKDTETAEKSVTITMYSEDDYSELDHIKIYASTYGSSKRSSITSFFGVSDFQFIPYFIGTSFTKSGGNLEQVSSNSNGHVTFEKVLGAFKNQGTWTVFEEGEDSAVLTIANPNDEHTYFKASMVRNGTGTNVTYSKENVIHSSFPVEAVKEVISKGTASQLVVPDDGTAFTFAKTSTTATVTSNGNADAYISKLSTNGYYVVDSGSSKVCVSPERTLKATITTTDEGFKVVYGTQSAPSKTAWSSNDANKMIALIGEEIPFIANDYGSWYQDENYMYASSTRLEAALVAVETLDKAVGYTKSVEPDGVYYSKDISAYASYSIIVDGTELYIYLMPKEVSNWLGQELADALKVNKDEIPAASGTSFMYMFGDEEAQVQVNGGALDVYKSNLEGAKYLIFDKYSSYGVVTNTYAVSNNREIVIELVSLDGGFGLSFSKQSPLTDIDWTDSDKEIMNDFMGELLPFVNDGFAGKWYSYYDEIYATSTRKEAQVIAKSVFDADSSFVYDDKNSTVANHIYDKSISKYQNITVTLNSSGRITVTKALAKLDTWEADDIALFLGSEPKEVLPAFEEEGATFSYEFGENAATIRVYTDSSATSMANYKDALASAGFTSADDETFKSPTDTLTVVVSKVANKQFMIEASGHLPEGQYRELPVNLIAKQLNNDSGLADLALPEGSLFLYEAKDKYECDVTVLEGGSMSAYITALGEKGFALKDDAYEKEGNNVRIALSAGEGDVYSAHLSLIEKPSKAEWPEDALRVIKSFCEYEEFVHESIPCPVSYTKVTTNEDSWVSYSSVVVEGVDVDAYVQALRDDGFNVSSNYYGYQVYESNSYWYLQLAVSGTTITITAY